MLILQQESSEVRLDIDSLSCVVCCPQLVDWRNSLKSQTLFLKYKWNLRKAIKAQDFKLMWFNFPCAHYQIIKKSADAETHKDLLPVFGGSLNLIGFFFRKLWSHQLKGKETTSSIQTNGRWHCELSDPTFYWKPVHFSNFESRSGRHGHWYLQEPVMMRNLTGEEEEDRCPH